VLYHLNDSGIDRFQTNLREVLKYIKYSKEKNKLREVLGTDNRFKLRAIRRKSKRERSGAYCK